MRPPRFRIRTLLIAVAVVADLIGSGIGLDRQVRVWLLRSVDYSDLAKAHTAEARFLTLERDANAAELDRYRKLCAEHPEVVERNDSTGVGPGRSRNLDLVDDLSTPVIETLQGPKIGPTLPELRWRIIPSLEKRVREDSAAIEQSRARARTYSRAARFPWLSVEPETTQEP